MSSSRRSAPFVVALALVVAIPHVRTIASGPSIYLAGPTDTLAFALPQTAAYRESVRAGELPLWNRTQLYGMGTLGDPQARVFYPPMLLYAALDMPLAHHVYALAHVLLLSLGTFALLRREKCTPAAAFLGAASLGLSWKVFAYLVAGWDTILGSFAWMPLAVLFFLRASREKDLRAAALLGAVLAASALAATPIFAAFFLVASPFLGALAIGPREIARESGARKARRLALALAVSAVLALLLLAPLVLASLDTSARSLRSDVGESYGTELPLAFPGAVRALALPDLSREDFAWERGNGLGLLALPLAFAGALVRRRRPLAVWLLVVFLLLAGGRATPIGRAVALLPVVGKLSYLTRLLWFSSLGLAVLAGVGADALLRAGKKRRATLALGLAVGSAVAIASLVGEGALRGLDSGPNALSPRTVSLLKASAIVALALAPLLAWLGPLARRAAVLALLALVPLELVGLSELTLVRVPFASLREKTPIERALEKEPFTRLAVVTSNTFTDPVVPLYSEGLERVGGCNPLQTRAAAHFLDAIAGEPLAFRPYRELERIARPDLLALGATHVATREPLPGSEPCATSESAIYAPCGDRVEKKAFLQGVKGALPRAYLMPRARSLRGDEHLAAMLAARPFSGETTLLVDGEVPEELRGDSEGPLPVEIVSHETNRVVLRATAPAGGGFVVFLDAFSPDWKATVDGAPGEIRRANHLFRAVRVAKGSHEVIMRVGLPRSFVLPVLGLTLLAFALLKRRAVARGS
ncbi:hypothetical protein HY251_09085 [bacterium]|nr:hypothetical protein [bacterium]